MDRMPTPQSTLEAIGFVSDSIEGGLSWSWPTILGALITEAQNRFGIRDYKWTILGIEFHGDIPHIWYPNNVDQISIVLTNLARSNVRAAAFELAHETVHLLSPNNNAPALVIEEGMATMFSNDMNGAVLSSLPSYLEAETLVRELENMYPGAIKSIREEEPNLRKFTPELIVRHCPKIRREAAISMCSTFVR